VQNAGSKSLFDDLDAALQGCSSEQRAAILRQLTDSLLSKADRLNEAQIGVLDGVLVQLAERIETRTMLAISQRLAPVARALINLKLNQARYSGARFSEDSLAALLRGREVIGRIAQHRIFNFL
jgi:hypothetical protein